MSVLFCNNNSMSAITSTPSGIGGGSMALISTQTASSSSTITFTSGIDSTYKEYIFKFINIHPESDDQDFEFQVDTGTNTNFNQQITSTVFRAYNNEAANANALSYATSSDLANGTGFQRIMANMDNDNDSNGAGTLHLFDPSSDTFVKHFIARTQYSYPVNSFNQFTTGYINTATAITRVRFKMESGNIDSGTIKLYGIS